MSISRAVKPYRPLLFLILLLCLFVLAYYHISSLKAGILERLADPAGTIDEVDLDSSLYEDGNKKGVDIKIKRNPIKQSDIYKKGGFAPIKKLKLATEEPAVELPPFFPKKEFLCMGMLKRVAGAWITHLRDPGDAQHRHRTDSWYVCFEERLTRLNAFRPRSSAPAVCVVYSFGTEDNWSFEEDMLLHGCEVHMFDSSEKGLSSIIRRKIRNLYIHRATLSATDHVATGVEGVEKRTLASLMAELGHERLDVLKLDIEGEELAALEHSSTTLVQGVDQILLEVHMHISDHAHDSAKPDHFDQKTIGKWSSLFTALRADGYRAYDIRSKGTDRFGNVIPAHEYSCCYRVALIKTPYVAKKEQRIGEADGEVANSNMDDLDLGM